MDDTSISNSGSQDASTRDALKTSGALNAGTPMGEPPSEREVADYVHPGSGGLLRVFRHRNYRLFFAGQLVSLMGTWMQSVAQAWLVYSLTHSPFLLGLTSFCSQVTVFFMASLGGMIADRVDRRKMLIVTQSLSMLQAALLAALTLMGVVQVWEIVVLAFGLGLVNSVDVPTRQAMTLDMVGREDLRHAIALNSMMFNLARVVGPSIAGILIAVVGEGVCFALNAASFGAVLSSLILMHFPQRKRALDAHPLKQVVDGYRYSWNSHTIRTALMLSATSSMFGAAYLTMLPAFARDVLHGTSTSYGTLMTTVGIGALGGAYFLARIREHWMAIAPVIAAVAFGLSLIVFAQTHSLWWSVALLLPTACALMLLGGTNNTNIQIAADEAYRGRVISHYTQCFMGMMPWGSLMLGVLASHIGVANAITLGGVAVLVFAGVAGFQKRNELPARTVAAG